MCSLLTVWFQIASLVEVVVKPKEEANERVKEYDELDHQNKMIKREHQAMGQQHQAEIEKMERAQRYSTRCYTRCSHRCLERRVMEAKHQRSQQDGEQERDKIKTKLQAQMQKAAEAAETEKRLQEELEQKDRDIARKADKAREQERRARHAREEQMLLSRGLEQRDFEQQMAKLELNSTKQLIDGMMHERAKQAKQLAVSSPSTFLLLLL